MHPLQWLGVVCQDCAHGHSPVEVFGLWVHQYRDRWISCNAKNQQKIQTAQRTEADTPLAEAGVASSQTA